MVNGSAPESRKFNHFAEIAGFIWQIADLPRGDYKQSDYGKVILPFTVLRRLVCVLEPTKAKVLARHEKLKDQGGQHLKIVLLIKMSQIPDLTPQCPRAHRRPAGDAHAAPK